MNQAATLIYDIKGLKLSAGSRIVLQIGNLQVHRGTIYGIIGPVGSGKTSLLKLLAGHTKPEQGTLKYDNEEFTTNWLGKIKKDPTIHLVTSEELNSRSSVNSYINQVIPKTADRLIKRHFNNGNNKQLLSVPVNELSPGEQIWLKAIIATESDPRVLLIDDYGFRFDSSMNQEFNRIIQKMTRELGTTIILAAASHEVIQNVASVLIFLDNGHICKIRPGKGRTTRTQRRRNY